MRIRSSLPFARGFTLVELLIVMAIIVTLAGILVPAVILARGKAAKAQTATMIAKLTGALELYSEDRGTFPTLRPGEPMTEEEQQRCLYLFLDGDPDDGHGGKVAYIGLRGDEVVGGLDGVPGSGADDGGGRLPPGTIVDGWGNGIRYLELRSVSGSARPAGARNHSTYDVTSAGPDGQFGTEDDCTN